MGDFNFICDNCSKPGTKPAYFGPQNRYKNHFCDRKCATEFRTTLTPVNCGWCGKQILRARHELLESETKKFYCNSSCAASFNNTQRRVGRRSKSEKQLFDLLVSEFPKLDLIPNDKQMLDGLEVDIAIPSLKLAIEWNGIVHFKPIYGSPTLNKIQERDARKLLIANQKDINLIVIPDLVSTPKYVQEAFFKIRLIVLDLQGVV
jgi:hypothetical protein